MIHTYINIKQEESECVLLFLFESFLFIIYPFIIVISRDYIHTHTQKNTEKIDINFLALHHHTTYYLDRFLKVLFFDNL